MQHVGGRAYRLTPYGPYAGHATSHGFYMGSARMRSFLDGNDLQGGLPRTWASKGAFRTLYILCAPWRPSPRFRQDLPTHAAPPLLQSMLSMLAATLLCHAVHTLQCWARVGVHLCETGDTAPRAPMAVKSCGVSLCRSCAGTCPATSCPAASRASTGCCGEKCKCPL